MTYEITVKNALKLFPLLFKSRLDVDEHLFAVIGNGYEWIDGELVDAAYYGNKEVNNSEAIIKHVDGWMERDCGAYLGLWCLENNKDRNNLDFEDIVNFVSHYHREIQNDIKNSTNYINSVDDSFSKYEHVPDEFEEDYWKIYPISVYSRLVNFPEDIKDDWREALSKFVNWCLEHPECIDERENVEIQLKFLKEAQERLKTMSVTKKYISYGKTAL